MVTITSDLKNLLESTILALSTVSADGIPNTIAVAFCKVVGEDKVLISDNFFFKTRQNLNVNNNVSLTFWNKENSPDGVGYQFKGVAEVLTSGPWKDMVDNFDFNQGQSHKAAILVTVNEIWDLAECKLISKL